jgi:2-dehydro-3-deoxygalactonokinase
MLSEAEREPRVAGGHVVAGDWGTSHLRLFLCDSTGACLESATGPGAAASGGRFAATLNTLLAPWRGRYGGLPVVLCGMVGSNIGWVQAPYLSAPILPVLIAKSCIAVEHGRVNIVPGLSCRNPFGVVDYMRGEETQVLGALRLNQALSSGRQILCLPGTHTKWVVIEDGCIGQFFTAPAGEVFAVLRDHSVMVRNPGGSPTDLKAFNDALRAFNAFPQAQLLHRLFECRARQLSGELSAPQAESYLSGLLIGSDVLGALQLLSAGAAAQSVCLIGSPDLTSLYSAALSFHAVDSLQLDGASAALAGLLEVHRHLPQGVLSHAV